MNLMFRCRYRRLPSPPFHLKGYQGLFAVKTLSKHDNRSINDFQSQLNLCCADRLFVYVHVPLCCSLVSRLSNADQMASLHIRVCEKSDSSAEEERSGNSCLLESPGNLRFPRLFHSRIVN